MTHFTAHPIELGRFVRQSVLEPLQTLTVTMLLGLFCGGCVTTPLNPSPPAPATVQLSALNRIPLSLTPPPPGATLRMGHQYMLIAVPFGVITLTRPGQVAFDAVFSELVLRGAQIPPLAGRAAVAVVSFDTITMAATVYDLLVVRRIVARVTLRMSIALQGAETVQFEAHGRAAAFKTRGFAEQITPLLDEALLSAARQIGDALRLPPSVLEEHEK